MASTVKGYPYFLSRGKALNEERRRIKEKRERSRTLNINALDAKSAKPIPLINRSTLCRAIL